MNNSLQAQKVTDDVYWVGAIDWGIRDFHGSATSRGTTYNAYLIVADKITLVDTVKAPFAEEMLTRIASVIDPAKIDYIISNHSEMDHSGSLPAVVERVKPEKVFASKMGVKAINAHFHPQFTIDAVQTGQELSLGNKTVSFVETKMLHWPDSMVTYLAEDQILFSQDAFGMHLASSERFDDQLDRGIMDFEAKKYYANILAPYSPLVAKLLPQIEAFPAPIRIVAPDHGPIWRRDFGWILDRYRAWSAQKPANKAIVVFDTMWGSTASMATAIADGLIAGGVQVNVMPMASTHRSDVATEMLDAAALIVGTPTLNNNMFPTIADLLCYLKGLRFTGKLGAAFGSFGWGGEAVKQVAEYLTEMKARLVHEDLKIQYVPDQEALCTCRDMGISIADEITQAAK